MNRGYRAFKSVFRVLLAAFVLIPFIWGFRTSILTDPTDLAMIPRHISFEHYVGFLTPGSIFWKAIRNSATVAISTILLMIPIVVLGSYALGRIKFKGLKYGKIFLYLPLVPPIALLVPLESMIAKMGLYNNLFAIVMMSTAFLAPFSMWLLRNFMKTLSPSLEEAATLDGCGRMRRMFYIVIPNVLPGIITVVVYVFIQTWLTFLYGFAVINNEDLQVVAQVVSSFIGAYSTDYSVLTAFSIIALVPPLIFFLFFQRWFIAGLFGNMSK